ncbi:TaqI-like C-terminal specificity domain-containing protein, partial [Helicobacter muridarum]|uniref:TaqI-like C-terminal specificity domain-containing protein n=1 Tax=Helicobacter muridarum TaxID=216 RepID=UPI001F380DF1
MKLLCENFELELKEAFRFCKGLQVPREYEGKIIYPNMAKEFIAYLDTQGFFTNQKCFILTDKCKDKNRLLYLTAVLNSKMNFWYFKHIGATLGANGYEMSKIFVERLPVIETHKIDSKLLQEIEFTAEQILESKTQSYNTQNSADSMQGKSHPRDNLPCGNGAVALMGSRGIVKGEKGENKSENLPLAPLTKADETIHFEKNKKQDCDTKTLESHLNSLIYQAYGLNEKEINLIESELSTRERENR